MYVLSAYPAAFESSWLYDELNKARREYQLSEQQRSELRQQLRQQWRDGMGK